MITCWLVVAVASLSAKTEINQSGARVVLQLSNGDRLTGELLWRNNGLLRIRSPILGDVTIPETALLQAGLLSQTASNPNGPTSNRSENNLPTPLKESATPSNTSSVASSAPVKTAPATSKSESAKIPPIKPWKVKLEFGYAQQTGLKNTLNYNVRGEAEKQFHQHSLRTTARLLYAEQNNRPNADRTDANFRWRYQLSKRTFAQALTTYLRDEITQIHANFEQNIGLGYRVIDKKRHALNIGAGITGQYRDWDAGTNGFAPYGEIFEDYTFKINDRINLVQDAVFQYSPEDRAFNIPATGRVAKVNPQAQNYKIRFNTSLQGKVTERVSVNLRYEYELDNAIQTKDARKNERITSAIGYAI